MADTVSESFSLEKVDWDTFKVSEEALETVDCDLAQRYGFFPLGFKEDDFEIAVSKPVDWDMIDTLSHFLGCSLKLKLALAEDIRQAITTHYKNDFTDVLKQEEQTTNNSSELKQTQANAYADAPLNDYFNNLIDKAIQCRASDIHIEPLETRLRVRFRIDGVLRVIEQLPLTLYGPIANQTKLKGGLDIAEKRLPQDGRIRIQRPEASFDLRLSTLPTAYGESLVMRLLNPEDVKKDFTALGFDDEQKDILQKLIQTPSGLILITGPTGSGKTTTLYTCLQKLNQTNRKIITLEDPIEYEIRGVNQIQIEQTTGMSFANALRAILRQSPDIIMVGEIRDQETAAIAINASLTGHLVISTLHTNDAPSAITRLLEMKARPFLLSASLRAVIAQRLVRALCPYCRNNGRESPGCKYCAASGYYGRTGIFEVLSIDEALQSLIHEGSALEAFRKQALLSGMRTLRESGVQKVKAGETTMEEVGLATMII